MTRVCERACALFQTLVTARYPAHGSQLPPKSRQARALEHGRRLSSPLPPLLLRPSDRMMRYTLNDDVTLKIASYLDLSSILWYSRVSAFATDCSDARVELAPLTLPHRRANPYIDSASRLYRSGSMPWMHTNSQFPSRPSVTTMSRKRSVIWRG